MIRSIGLLWRVEDVDWGAGSRAGKLLGVPAARRTAKAIDFRNQSGIYVLYNPSYEIMYIGQTGKNERFLMSRLKDHRKGNLARRWDRFSGFGFRWVKKNGELSTPTVAQHSDTAEALNIIEAILIHSAEPPLNKQGGRFGKEVERYLQKRDARTGTH